MSTELSRWVHEARKRNWSIAMSPGRDAKTVLIELHTIVDGRSYEDADDIADTLLKALKALTRVAELTQPRTEPPYAWESADGWAQGYDQAMETIREEIERILKEKITDADVDYE